MLIGYIALLYTKSYKIQYRNKNKQFRFNKIKYVFYNHHSFRSLCTICGSLCVKKKEYSISQASCVHILHHYWFIVNTILSIIGTFYVLHKTSVPQLVILYIDIMNRLWYNEINQNRKGVLL